ncbi:MAG TPA: hypothetical protein G4N94_07435 [Caldilineae bacterium]|nr:hypothetical protein [Caldilineae bacterium]
MMLIFDIGYCIVARAGCAYARVQALAGGRVLGRPAGRPYDGPSLWRLLP